jgi:ribosomal protein L9
MHSKTPPRSNSNSSSKADKAEKAAEKKRKKAEARAQKEKLMLELKKKEKAADEASMYSSASNERNMIIRSWEEDIAVYGSLASM